VKGVSDFLTAGRVAGRYVISVASGEAAMGLISLVAAYEAYYNSGFAYSFWSTIYAPISILLVLTGYCIYRFRETRAMTMGQFLQIRYSRSFRITAAILQSISGIINYAIFPAVGARFLIYYCNLPLVLSIGGWCVPTFAILMAVFLSLAVIIVALGGQITIMVTDCVQGLLSYPMYVVVVLFIFWKFSWFQEMAPALLDRPPGKSMLNPFDISQLRDFNLFYVVVGIFGSILNRMSWAGTQGYNAAAATPHEQKMGAVLGAWRDKFANLMYVLLAIVAFMFLHHAHYAAPARAVRNELAWKALNDVAGDEKYQDLRSEVGHYIQTGQIAPGLRDRLEGVQANKADAGHKGSTKNPATGETAASQAEQPETAFVIAKRALESEDKGKAQTFATIYGQMRVPLTLRAILPIGITGVFCALAIFLLVSTDTTYLHSWGSILIQDVILPFRKNPFTPRQQLLLLRLAISGVAVFAFFFSFFFGQVDYIKMFFIITGAIWLGGAGPVIVGGLYWKRGTATGAWASLLSGSILAVSGFILQNTWVEHVYPWLAQNGMLEIVRRVLEGISDPFRPYINWRVTGGKFPLNSAEIYFLTMIVSLTLYIGLSLLTCRRPFNMDRMLHRGKYRLEGNEKVKEPWSLWGAVKKLVGISSEYTIGDKAMAWSVFIWAMGWGMGSWVVILIWNTLWGSWPNHWWATWFFIQHIIVAAAVGSVTTVWFTIGGTWDLVRLFKRLEAKKTNVLDDGRVVDHVSAADVALVENVEHVKIPEAHEAEQALAEEMRKEKEDKADT